MGNAGIGGVSDILPKQTVIISGRKYEKRKNTNKRSLYTTQQHNNNNTQSVYNAAERNSKEILRRLNELKTER